MGQAKGKALFGRAQKVIPGGMYGHQSTALQSPSTPQFFSKAEGTYLWDYDGNRYIDLMSGYGPNLFGYAHAEINAAFASQLAEIDTATGPSARIIELAEAYVDQIAHAEWALFCKNGTDATSIALRTARAYRGKRKVVLAKDTYHGAADWCTPFQTGTIGEERSHFIYHEYNNAESLEQAVREAGDDLAGIMLTPIRHEVIVDNGEPTAEYAKCARRLCDDHDALLMIDEVRAGFRLERECSWCRFGVDPDLSMWGKLLANGHPISAVLGSEKARGAASKVYVTGSFWFSAAPMAAALKTLELIQTTDYLERTIDLGLRLREGLDSISKSAGLPISQTGPAQMPLVMFNQENGQRDIPITYAFCEIAVEHGVYFHPFHNMFINAAMTAADIDQILEVADRALRSMPARDAIEINPAARAALESFVAES